MPDVGQLLQGLAAAPERQPDERDIIIKGLLELLMKSQMPMPETAETPLDAEVDKGNTPVVSPAIHMLPKRGR